MASTDTAMSAATATTTTNTTAMSHPHLQAHNRTLSNISTEDLFSSITGFDDLAGDDDLSFDDVDDDDETGEGGKKGSGKKSGKIRNSSTAEKKATHNAVERARRESLNARFLVLADMLPGMTHVKRASKAAIVNKSIEFIREMHKAENRLVKENDALKAELEALRQRVNTSPGHNGGATGPQNANGSALGLTNANAAHAQAHAQAAAAAAVAAAAAGMPPQHMPQHHLFPGMHPMQMQMPMMPHLPAAMASVAAAAAAHNGGNPTLGAGVHQTLPPAPTAENANKPAAHQQPAPPSAGLPAPSNAELGQHLFPGIFTGLFNAGGAFDNLEHARSESGSPAGSSISQQQQHQPGSRNGGSAQFSHGLFELPPMSGYTTEGGNKVGSPSSYHSPPGTVASLAGSERTSQSQHSSSQLTNNTAPSPASSHSVPTPANAYSPLNLPGLTATPQSAHSLASQQAQAQAMTDPAIAAFDGSADAAYLAAQFAPGDLAKAQHELHAFIAYQQRMAYAGQQQQQQQQQSASGPQQHPSPTNGNGQMSPTLFPPHGSFGFQQQQQQPQMPFAGVCGPTAQASMAGLPAWQMMMAQQQAMVAAYGQQGHY